MSGGMAGGRAWQGAIILLLTVMISLNLRILVNVQYDDRDLPGRPILFSKTGCKW